MALSNIFREPRREITETLVGLIIVPALVAYGFLGHWLASFVYAMPTPIDHVAGVVFGVVFLAFNTVLAIEFMVAVHAVGEIICAVLAERGVELRPKERGR